MTDIQSATDASGESTARPLDAVTWPVRTERLVLRPATAEDVVATWRFRRLEEVGRWLTGTSQTLEDYRPEFEDPEWLSKTLVVELDGEVIGDLMLSIESPWAQKEVVDQAQSVQAQLGWVLDPDQRRPRVRHRGGPRAAATVLRGPRAPTGHCRVLRRQRGVMAPDGASRHAS